MAQSQQQQPQAAPQLQYVDQPEISETFVDSLGRWTFENALVKMEFLVNRMDDLNPSGPPTGRAMTACRIVIPLPGMIDMLGKLQAIMAQLQAANIIRPISSPPTGGRPN
jgi:hypothetical protein